MASVSRAHDVFAETLRAHTGLSVPAPAPALAQAPAEPLCMAAQHRGKGTYLCADGSTLQLSRHVMGQGCFGKVVSGLWLPPANAEAVSSACVVAIKKPKRTRFCPAMFDAQGVLHTPGKDTAAFARASRLCADNLENEARGAHLQRAVLSATAVVRTAGKALLVLPHMATTVQAFSANLAPSLREPLVWHLLPPLLAQLEAAAPHGANGDIKAGNTLMRGHAVALCDFGWATSDEARGYTTGAQRFRAPEAFFPERRLAGAMPKADIYSLGLMLLITATGLRAECSRGSWRVRCTANVPAVRACPARRPQMPWGPGSLLPPAKKPPTPWRSGSYGVPLPSVLLR